ncbi:uncharacterized protein LOC128982006 isoform X4 [Macrosteles quadrilineatus]|uniref:uncharacterized protein LOC128982006 isoform X4 n=1 Tax=Macrosteles quadrilineatus TaxID=74068 RepID=UPI0023E1E4B2|nr:uncharacterized protein LOC128982006 isoform X4 [Macrosteles quadrilineatus]
MGSRIVCLCLLVLFVDKSRSQPVNNTTTANKTSVEQPHIEVSPIPVVEGAEVTFDCKVHYEFGVKVALRWTLPHAHLNESGRFLEHEEIDEKNPGEHNMQCTVHRTLTFTDVSLKDEGPYICTVTDNSGNTNSNAVTLSVIPSGKHKLKLDIIGYQNTAQIHVNPGTPEFKLLVEIQAYPPPKSIQWYDNYMKPIIGKGDSFIAENSPTLSKLIIREPRVDNSGTYTLVVNNKAMNESVKVTLLVKGAPELRLNNDIDEAYYMLNKSYSISCDVYALPRPIITWSFQPCPGYPSCTHEFSMIPKSQYVEHDIANVNPAQFNSVVEIQAVNTGILQCQACNDLKCNERKISMLLTDVEGGMSIDAPELVVETDNVTLSCGASKYNYTGTPGWVKVEKSGATSEFKGVKSETKYSYFNKLNLPRVGKNHSGVYICSAKLSYERNRAHTKEFTLDVKGEECISNDECSSGKICIAKKCTDPCDGVCGMNTICLVLEGAPVCSCKADYEGDPFTECKPVNAECTDDSMCTTDKTCIGHKCVDPCLDYCGLNTVCRVVNHRPVCACLKGFFLTLDKGCNPKWIPECQTNSHCPDDRSCRLQKCVDPCQDGVCGNNTECHVKNHYPVCSCKVGYIGDAYNECVPYGSTDYKENIQKPIQERKTFIRVNEMKQWWDALRHCIDHGMKLATIENDDEWNSLVETFGNADEGVWIGGHDFGKYPNFLWISTGLPVVLLWRAGEPTGSNYNCLAADPHHGFFNSDCIIRHSFVCEQRKTDT